MEQQSGDILMRELTQAGIFIPAVEKGFVVFKKVLMEMQPVSRLVMERFGHICRYLTFGISCHSREVLYHHAYVAHPLHRSEI